MERPTRRAGRAERRGNRLQRFNRWCVEPQTGQGLRPCGTRAIVCPLLVHGVCSCYQPTMSWLPDSGWLRALDLSTSIAAAVSLGCWAILGLAEFDFLYLGVLPVMIRAAVAIIAVLASLLWLGRLWDLGFAHFTKWRLRRGVLAQLDTLNTGEAELLGTQAENNEQTFYAPMFHDPIALGLVEKGLAQRSRVGTPMGASYTIPDFVWREMRRRWPRPRATRHSAK